METAGKCLDHTAPSDAELAIAKATVRDEFLAGLMLSGANRDRFNTLQYELTNQYGFGNDLYPKTVDQCLTMLNRHKDAAPHQPRNAQHQHQHRDATPKPDDEALVFTQGSDAHRHGSSLAKSA